MMKKINIFWILGILLIGSVFATFITVDKNLLFNFEKETGILLEECIDCELDLNGIVLGLIEIKGVWYPITSQELLDILISIREKDRATIQVILEEINLIRTELGLPLRTEEDIILAIEDKIIELDIIYYCKDNGRTEECPNGLSNPNAEGLQTRCYQEMGWFNCKTGWVLQ